MYDKILVLDILKQISDHGLEKLDSICMQLIALGEALKQVDKLTDSTLLSKYATIDWKKAKGLRDIITHHYFDIDSEIVYAVCKNRLPEMKIIIDQIIKDIVNYE